MERGASLSGAERGKLGGGLKRDIPAGEYEYCRMALEGTGKNLRTLNTEINSTVLDSGNGGLRNTGEFRELALAQILEFAQDTDRLTDRNLNAFLGGTIIFHIRASGNVGGNLNDLNQQHVGNDLVNHSPLESEPGGTVSLPLAGQRFVVKPLDRSQSRRARKASDVFPFLVPF